MPTVLPSSAYTPRTFPSLVLATTRAPVVAGVTPCVSNVSALWQNWVSHGSGRSPPPKPLRGDMKLEATVVLSALRTYICSLMLKDALFACTKVLMGRCSYAGTAQKSIGPAKVSAPPEIRKPRPLSISLLARTVLLIDVYTQMPHSGTPLLSLPNI